MKDLSETKTCLYREQRARKDHPRIALRGALDMLLAQTVCCQLALRKEGCHDTEQQLAALPAVIRALLFAEYEEQPIDLSAFDSVDWEGMYKASHNPMTSFGIPHPAVDADMGEGVAALNLLRTQVRACERLAVTAFDGKREDIVHVLNRMSSFVYALMCMLCAKGDHILCR